MADKYSSKDIVERFPSIGLCSCRARLMTSKIYLLLTCFLEEVGRLCLYAFHRVTAMSANSCWAWSSSNLCSAFGSRTSKWMLAGIFPRLFFNFQITHKDLQRPFKFCAPPINVHVLAQCAQHKHVSRWAIVDRHGSSTRRWVGWSLPSQQHINLVQPQDHA